MTVTMSFQSPAIALVATLAWASGACAQQQPSPPVHGIPPAAAVHGRIRLTVAYPAPGSAVDARDSIFVFGNSGTGDAHVTVDGTPARVAPDGGWLAWIAIPGDSAFTLRIEARDANDSAAVRLPLAHADWVRETGAWVDRASFDPVGDVRAPVGEVLTFSVRAAPGAHVRLLFAGRPPIRFIEDSIPEPIPEGVRNFDRDIRNLRRVVRGDHYVAVIPVDVRTPAAALLDSLRALAPPILEVSLRGAVTRTPWPVSLRRARRSVEMSLDANPLGLPGINRTTAGRDAPTGTYTWFLPPGTETAADMRQGDMLRLAVGGDRVAWVPVSDAHPIPTPPDVRAATMGTLTVTPGARVASLRIPLTYPVPLQIDDGDARLDITLFHAVGNANWTRYGAGHRFIKAVTWTQETSDRVHLVVTLERPLWGWRVRRDGTDLVVDLREPPVIDGADPVRNLRIAVDAGHPPGGACGPTGLCEPEANLAVATALGDALTARGAIVLMTRTTPAAVELWPRVAAADSADADLLISIHQNALPEGLNPFTNTGSSTFYNHLISLDLARDVQAHLVTNLDVGDLGVARGDLELVRPTWYPAILTEGLFLMFPDQEAALRTRDGDERYATAIAAGLREYLRGFSSTAAGGTSPR